MNLLLIFFKWCKHVQNKKGVCITSIKSDHKGEFENDKFQLFCEENGILHNSSTPRAPQPNGVVKRKNRSLPKERTWTPRTMLNDNSTLSTFGLKQWILNVIFKIEFT